MRTKVAFTKMSRAGGHLKSCVDDVGEVGHEAQAVMKVVRTCRRRAGTDQPRHRSSIWSWQKHTEQSVLISFLHKVSSHASARKANTRM